MSERSSTTSSEATTAAGATPLRDPARALTAAGPLYQPVLGEDGAPCANCGAPLASDQRYCLRCGERRAEARLPFLDILGETPRTAPAPPPALAPAPELAWWRPGPLAAVGVGAAAILIFALGLLAGGALKDSPPAQPAVVQAAPTATPAATPSATATAAPAAFTSDWPAGKKGWTVQLQTLPKSGSDAAAVAAAKTAAQGRGAADVGALDSDQFAGLDGGNYVVYSGSFDAKKAAESALDGLKANFPDAKVVQVSTTAGGSDKAATVTQEDLQKKKNLTPEQAEKESRKAPEKVQTEGTPPPKDNKQPGGGSDETTIG